MLRFQHRFPGELTKEQPLPNAGRASPFVSRPNQCIQRKTEHDLSRRVAGEIISLPVFFRSWKRRTQSADLRRQTPVPKSRYVTKQILHRYRKTRISTQSVSHWRERNKNGTERTAKFSTALSNWPKACRELDEALLKTHFFSCGSFARQVSRLFRTCRAGHPYCFIKSQVDGLWQNGLVAKVPKVYSLRLQSAPIRCNSKVLSTSGLRSSYWTRI